MSVFNFEAPRAPNYQKPARVEECLPQARILVQKAHGRAAMGPVRRKDKILIVTLPDQDPYVRQAVSQALKEAGAAQVDFIFEHDLSGGRPRVFSAEDGWREANTLENEPWDLSGSQFYSDINTGLWHYLNRHPEYTGVFYGLGGRYHLKFQLKEHAEKFRGCWLFNNWEEFLSRAWTYPDELEIEIERIIIDALGKAACVRITDPEGTHLEFSLTPEESRRWQMTSWLSGHIYLDPHQATGEECAVVPVSRTYPPIPPRINGVLAGTANHMGFMPRMALFFENGRLVQVSGGGRYGEMIRELMDRYRQVRWPGYAEKGFFWFCDCVLCTVVKSFRHTSDLFHSYWRMPNIGERNRAGVFHMGIGSRRHGDRYMRYAAKHRLPTGHIHVHSYFATFEIKLHHSDYWYKIVDKGKITALSDPKIRALAVKYGDPDRLLAYDWVPPMPGINCEGDYLKDYADDPIGYLKNRLAENRSI